MVSNALYGNEAYLPYGTYFDGRNPYSKFNVNRYGNNSPFIFNPNGIGPNGTNINQANAFAENAGMRKLVRELDDAISNNNTSAIVETWDKLFEQYKKTAEYKAITQYGDKASEQAAIGRLQEIYGQMTNKNILEQIDACSHGNLISSIIGGMTVGIVGDKSSDQLKAELFKTSIDTASKKTVRAAGSTIGGAATGAAIGAAAGAWFFGIGAVPGAIIGGAVGAAAGFISRLWS